MQETDIFLPRFSLSSPSVASVNENKFGVSQGKPKDGNIKGRKEHMLFCLHEICFCLQTSPADSLSKPSPMCFG